MQIYRVEDDNGGGPYNGDQAPRAFTPEWRFVVNGVDGINDTENQPSPNWDIPNWETYVWADKARPYRFGFANIEQVHRWFRENARAFLNDHGYKIAKYEVPDHLVLVGGHQVAFNAKKAKLIERISLVGQLEMDLITKPSAKKKLSTKVDIPF